MLPRRALPVGNLAEIAGTTHGCDFTAGATKTFVDRDPPFMNTILQVWQRLPSLTAVPASEHLKVTAVVAPRIFHTDVCSDSDMIGSIASLRCLYSG